MNVSFAGRGNPLAPGTIAVPVGRPGVVRQHSLREHNLGLILGLILDAPAPLSRADLAQATSLTRAATGALVDLLVAAQMVTELAPVATRKAGRPGVPLAPAAGTMVGIGLEINLDYLGARAIDLAGNVMAETIHEGNYRQTDPGAVLNELAEVASKMAYSLRKRGVQIVGACIALPGLVDRGAGPLRLAPNLGWCETDLAPLLDHPLFTDLGVRLANDANLAARAEGRALALAVGREEAAVRKRDAPQGTEASSAAVEPDAALTFSGERSNFLYVSGEVGIGGAFVHDSKVFVGEHGWSGELGHTTIEPFGPLCKCGAQGCLEQYAGKDAIMDAAELPLSASVDDLLAAVSAGSEAARAAVERAGWALGLAFANFINLTDISMIVLGGIYDPLIGVLRGPIERELHARVLGAPWSTYTIVPALAGRQAAMTGAALSVLGMVVSDPSAWGATDPTS